MYIENIMKKKTYLCGVNKTQNYLNVKIMKTTKFTVGSCIVNSTKTKGYMILDIVDVNTKSYGGDKVQYFYVRYLGKQKTAFIKASSVSKWTNY